MDRVNVVEGDYVKSGEVLVILDDADELLRLQRAVISALRERELAS